MTLTNRSKDWVDAWAVIERRGKRLALFDAQVPVYWLRKIAQARANKFGADHVYVEKVTIHRRFKKP